MRQRFVIRVAAGLLLVVWRAGGAYTPAELASGRPVTLWSSFEQAIWRLFLRPNTTYGGALLDVRIGHSGPGGSIGVAPVGLLESVQHSILAGHARRDPGDGAELESVQWFTRMAASTEPSPVA